MNVDPSDWFAAEARCKELFEQFAHNGDLTGCASALEAQLAELPVTPFHKVIGKQFVHHSEAMARLLADYVRLRSEQAKIKVVYIEMNGFAFNTDTWFCNLFCANNYDGSPRSFSFGDYCTDTESDSFPLTGMEELQAIFEDRRYVQGEEAACKITNFLIVTRFSEMIFSAHRLAKEIEPRLKGLPVVSTAHDEPEWAISESR